LAVITWLSALLVGICMLFWYHEWVYSLPTPIPPDYKVIKLGQAVDLNDKSLTGKKPLFLHFFNPDCPCSRFNIPHFRSLVRRYTDKVSFAIVVMSKDSTYTAEGIQKKFNLTIPVLFDKRIATSCGVYSTPQAVILDCQRHLYYRGNYNKSRYCTDKNSNYAQIALDSLLNNNSKPLFSPYALKAYGCTLPGCKK